MTLMTSQLQCRLCPALVATAGGDLALLEEHLHSLHRVAGAGHLQLARAVTLLSRGEVATILAKLGPRLTLLTTTGLLDYNITLIDEDIDEEEDASDDGASEDDVCIVSDKREKDNDSNAFEDLKRLLQRQESDLKHNCERCNLKFISITSLNCHKLKVHKEYTKKTERVYKYFKKSCRINDNTAAAHC